MGQHLEDKIPSMGMNLDDENRLVNKNESRFILNLHSGSSDNDNMGAVENIKGNTEIIFELPDGRNKVIGSYSKQKENANFFFLWNSLGYHTIYMYLSDIKEVRTLSRDILLNFSEFDLINDINVVGDLLYFRDIENPPRKINFKKSDVSNPTFRQEWNWYLGDNYLDGETSLILNIRQKQGNQYSSWSNLAWNLSVSLPTGETDKKKIAIHIANEINTGFTSTIPPINITASSCGEFVRITSTISEYTEIIAMKNGVSTAQVVPQNHYAGYVERTIDAIKHPPNCEPKSTLESDVKFNRNYIKEKVFQFAVRYIYDDDEKSTISPYSTHIYNKFICSQFQTEYLKNFIRVDISVFPEINNILHLQTIKQIELFVRIGETGKWKTIKVLKQFEFVDVNNQHYDFYNNGVYDVVNQEDFVRPFDSIPQRTKNQEVVKNRIFYGNNLEGYGNHCINTDINISYDNVEERVKTQTHDVSGVILIRSSFNGSRSSDEKQDSCAKYQAIRKGAIQEDKHLEFALTGNFYLLNSATTGGGSSDLSVWGGISEGFGTDPAVYDVATVSGQILPLNGFTVYLAGTDFYDISTQNIGTSHDNVAQDPSQNGVYYSPSPNDAGNLVNKIRENMKNKSGESTTNGKALDKSNWDENDEDTETQCYSTFNIKNVPDGWYMLRVASHTITNDDLSDTSRGWQKTSTNVYKITNLDALANPSSVNYIKSAMIGHHELLVKVEGGNIPRIKIELMDLTHASIAGGSKSCTGYLVDNDIEDGDKTYPALLQETRISNSLVEFNLNPGDVNYPFYSGYYDDARCLTDHNGYFWYASIKSYSPLAVSLIAITGNVWNIGPQTNSTGTPKLSIIGVKSRFLGTDFSGGIVVEKNNKIFAQIEKDNYAEIIVQAKLISTSPKKSSTFTDRTEVKGIVKDSNGIGIPKASICSTRTPAKLTDSNGEYQFWHYGIINMQPIYDTILIPVRSSNTCSAIYDLTQIYNFNFDYSSVYYNGFTPSTVPNMVGLSTTPTLVIEVSPEFEGDTSSMITINAMKRGWDGKFGIEYLDRGNRSGAVNTEKKIKIHIPFYTEKDENGILNNGVPILSWKVKHLPPSWATHWQWVRTRNLSVGNYFQWAIRGVKYYTSDEATTETTYNSAIRIGLDLSNYTVYKQQFPSLDLEGGIDVGWRARFITDKNGNKYQEYLDYEIIAVASGHYLIEKDFSIKEDTLGQGTVIEFYNDLLDITEDIYYEFGECFEVGTDSLGNKFHKGLTTDQDPLLPDTIPATGTFRTGDAYYRIRGCPDAGKNSSVYIDDDGVSDFYKSEVESIGRPNGEDSDAAQLWKPNQIRHSGKYIPDSKINNLNQFISDKFSSLPIEYGEINKLKLSSNVLMAIQKYRWVSNYIEQVVTRKQDGTDDLIASNDVFGGFRVAKEHTGTINQESVVEYRGVIYAYDMNKGEVYRWAGDGLTPISKYKVSNYFTDKSRDILLNMNFSQIPVRVIGVFDPSFDEYILSFSELIGIDKQVIDNPKPRPNNPTSKINVDIVNSQIIESVSNDSLISARGNKESGSNLIIDEATSLNSSNIEVENKIDSSGILRVKVRNTNGEINDVVNLEAGQGIKDFNISTKSYNAKDSFVDSSNQLPTIGNILSKGETIAYSERIDKWTTFYSFKPEMFGIINLEMISFVNGRLWIHNSNDIRNNFYGTQYTSQLEVLFNELPGQVKVFQSIGVESGHAWQVPYAKTPNGMETEIVSDRFVRREDSFFAPVMRDKNDPSFTSKPVIEAVINGRQLRDRSVKALLESTETNEVVLFAVSMMSTLSSRHQK